MKIIRVFPRRTNATPDDDLAIVKDVPGMFDEADEIHISVAFEWDKPHAEYLAYQWEAVAPVKIGGPAYGDPGGEFIPGMYLKPGYTITSRGCPNYCWFCRAWRNEGNIRELDIKEGYNVLDNNLLACSQEHQEQVFLMLKKQKERPRFTGGFEAKRFTEWHVQWMTILRPEIMFFAYDTPDDREPLLNAGKLLKDAGIIRNGNHGIRCYVLIGYKGDTIKLAESRLIETVKAGFFPMAMLYDLGEGNNDKISWKRFQREWANPTIIGSKIRNRDNLYKH